MEGLRFACLALRLVSDLHKLTQSHSDPQPSENLTETRSEPPSLTQIYSDSFGLARIRTVSFRSTCPSQIKDSLRSARSHSDSFRFLQPPTDLLIFLQSRSDSRRFIQNRSSSFRSIQSPANSFILTQSRSRFSLFLILSFTFTKSNSDLLRLGQTGQS